MQIIIKGYLIYLKIKIFYETPDEELIKKEMNNSNLPDIVTNLIIA
ncbi:hypothetical protein LJB96_02740 [Methanobrevibacter sp. OttesenSCG-928-K11]|nr:hypothetical protein [Methanobrevibacter sp. OttesenSCG-928-K11]MDL2270526.1 hypothetical protein [Methanobrevibacter sp. OttesenSCG-928-I08]